MKKAFVFLSVLCVVLIFSCQKDSTFTETETTTNATAEVFRSYSSTTVEHFFDLTYASSLLFSPTSTAESRSGDVHPSILTVQDFLYEENEVNPFVEELVDSIGYPAWDAARLFDSDEKTIVLIPYIQEGDQDIDNILYVKTEGDDLYMKFLNRSLLWDIISDSDGSSALLSELESDFLYFDDVYFGIGLTDDKAISRATCPHCNGCSIGSQGKCTSKDYRNNCDCQPHCAGCRQVEVIDAGGGVGGINTIFLHPWWFYPEKTIHNSNNNPNVGPNNNGNNGGGGSSAPPCEAPYEEPTMPNQGGSFNLILDDLFAQLSPDIQNQITGLAGTINISAHSWKWLMRHPETITAMYNHQQSGGSTADLQAYFDVVTQYTCVLNTDASFEDILKMNELMNDEDCSMYSNDGGYDLAEMVRLANDYPDLWSNWDCEAKRFVLHSSGILEIISSLTESGEPLTPEEQAAIEFFLFTMQSGLSDASPDNIALQNAIEEYWPGPTFPVGPTTTLLQIELEVMYLRELHKDDPTWTDAWLYAYAAKNVFSETTHTLLDLCGLFEGPGIVCDGINALFYLAEGNGSQAAIAGVAMVPFLGWAVAGKKMVKAINGVSGRAVKLVFDVGADGIITFGRRGQLATVIGKQSGHQAHHMIPWRFNDNKVVQLAAKKGWHPNDFANGFSLPVSRHNGSHQNYDDAILRKLVEIDNLSAGNADDALQYLQQLAGELSGIFENTILHVNDLQLAAMVDNIVL